MTDPADKAQSHREAMARRSREQSKAVADIGEIPPVKDQKRRDDCERDLHTFLVTYFPNSTGRKPFSEDHKRAIGRLQSCILDGGLFCQAFPRGFAKTTISENAILWATLYGHRKFVPIFGADANAAGGNIDSIQLELSENDLLYEDFPEVCHAIRALEGKAQRCASQTHKGKLTHIEYKADLVVLPTIEGSVASGAIITARGIEGGCRGMKHKRPDGTQQRPDFVILDDPQTDQSASTDLQVEKRLNIIRKSILKLGGHDRKIAVVMNATVIKRGDLVEQLLDPKKFPAWQGERIKMVRKWADAHDTLWLEDYKRLRNTYDPEQLGDQQRAHREATEFYRLNREKMDAGCEVAWEHCYNEEVELSAIQHAYNLFIDDGPEVFASEAQNDPLDDQPGDVDTLTADQITSRVNRVPRGVVPAGCSRLVVFVDVQKEFLSWIACAFGEGFTGGVVDYGTYPDQKRAYFHRRDVRQTLAKATKADTLDAQIYQGLDALVTNLMARDWKREGDEARMRPEKILIDANYGDSTDAVYLFCRRSPHAAVLMPTHGKYCGAKGRPLNDAAAKPGERRGWGWRIPADPGRMHVRYALIDTNAWKTRMHGFLKVPVGGRGCVTLFGDAPEAHKLLGEHLTAEYPTAVSANGRTVTEWQIKPSRPDNEWLDGLVGCGVAASMLGVGVNEESARRTVKRVKLSEMQRKSRTWKAK